MPLGALVAPANASIHRRRRLEKRAIEHRAPVMAPRRSLRWRKWPLKGRIRNGQAGLLTREPDPETK